MSVKLIVFDIAGTTVKDESNVSKAFQAALKNFGYEVALEKINPLMGYEKQLAIRRILETQKTNSQQITQRLIGVIHREFVRLMIQFYEESPTITPLPNVEATFEKLHQKDILIGLNTGFSKNIAETILNRLQWREKGLVDFLAASDEVQLGRPHPYMIEKIMEDAGLNDPALTAKVGDTEVDIREGQNAGCRYVIGITTGTFSKEELEPYRPTHIINNISEVLDIIS